MTVVNYKLTSCCDRFTDELTPCQDWYKAEDQDGIFDVEASFAPPAVLAVFFKFLALCYVTFVFVYTLWNADNRAIYFGMLTYWALTFSVVYLWMSTINSIVGVQQPNRKDNVSFRVGFQWFMFNVAVHTSLAVVILYWLVVFEPDETAITFSSFSTHAGTCLTLLLEGFVVNRIPIRWFFWWGTGLLTGIAYLVWTIVHAKLDIGNPDKEDSDLLYDSIDWDDDLSGTIILFAVSILILGPIIQSMLFVTSIYGSPFYCGSNKRRYLKEDEN